MVLLSDLVHLIEHQIKVAQSARDIVPEDTDRFAETIEAAVDLCSF